jgi:hypothetical protein
MKTPTYVLYIEHDSAPHEVSVHETFQEATSALLDFAEAIDGELIRKNMPLYNVVDKLAEYNEYARIYKCFPDGGSDEVDLLSAEEAAA